MSAEVAPAGEAADLVVPLRSASTGETVGEASLPASVFAVEVNVPVMHQVVVAHLAGLRSGTAKTKTRAEVRGGGSKPWKQKGTGRARQGSNRAPHWRGGGVVHGPQPRDYSQRTPKKMVRLALRSALSDRAGEGRVTVVDDWGLSAPATKTARQALVRLGLGDGARGRGLVVLAAGDDAGWKSFRNLARVEVVPVSGLGAYEVLKSDWVAFTRASLEELCAAQAKPIRGRHDAGEDGGR